MAFLLFFFFQAEDGIRAGHVTGVQTCALPISGGPLRGAEARLRRLRERPDTEVLAAGDAPAGVVAIALALQREAERIDEQLAALRRVGGDDRHARDEENVHVVQPTGHRPVASRSVAVLGGAASRDQEPAGGRVTESRRIRLIGWRTMTSLAGSRSMRAISASTEALPRSARGMATLVTGTPRNA